MKYTHYSASVNRHIDKDLQTIIKTIKKHTPDLVSIVLGGGYARGEGSVKITDKQVMPLNDYDLYYFTNKPQTETQLRKLNTLCNQSIQTPGLDYHEFEIFYSFDQGFFVDLHHLTVSELPHLPPMIRYWDLKYNSQVLFGPDVRKKIPKFDPQLVYSQPETLRLLFNRMTNLLQYFRPSLLKDPSSYPSHETLIYFSCRMIITTAQVLLMSSKLAPNSLKQTISNFNKLPPKHPFIRKHTDFAKHLKLAIQWKLKPYSIQLDPLETWFFARDTAGSALRSLLNLPLDSQDFSPNQLANFISHQLPQTYYQPYIRHKLHQTLGWDSPWIAKNLNLARIYLNLLYFHRLKKITGKWWPQTLFTASAPDLQIFSSLTQILFAISKQGKINRNQLSSGYQILNHTYPLDWQPPKSNSKFLQQLAESYGNAYVSFFWQKLV